MTVKYPPASWSAKRDLMARIAELEGSPVKVEDYEAALIAYATSAVDAAETDDNAKEAKR